MLLKKLSTILIAFTLLFPLSAKATNTFEQKRYICRDCSENENAALSYFQDAGITDKNALATILGNIKQESQFIPNVCEGGGIVPYHQCRGGFGLIQFTASSRYYGLGTFSRQINGDPSSFDTQLKYIVTEPEWKVIENGFKQPGKSISQYMRYAFSWLRWGVKGPRESYAYDYANRLIQTDS
jgi:hypothetical protein